MPRLSLKRRGRQILAAATLALLVAAGSAQARPFNVAEEAAYAEAAAFWGQSPTLCTSITKEAVPPGSLDWSGQRGVLGTASMPKSTNSWGAEACHIRVVEGLDPDLLCFVMRHEYGHLLGFDHDHPNMQPTSWCTAPIGPIVVDDPATVSRRQGWEEWRELAATCREARRGGPKRARCWRAARVLAAKIRSGRY